MVIKSYGELKKLCSQIFRAAGATSKVADRVVSHLVSSNLVGIDSHGIMRLPDYISWLRENKVSGEDECEVLKDKGAICLVDAHFSFGSVAASRSVEIVIQKAKKYGIGLVSVKNASHLGRIGEYVEDIALQGFIGFACCNSQGAGQFVAPWGGKEARLTTNPMAWGVPSSRNSGPMVLDMATSVVPEGKIRLKMRRQEKIPDDWVIDAKGQPTTNPADLYEPPGGAILPFGRHKGYGLALMMEILSGGLSGGGLSRPVKERFTIGSAFLVMAIEVESFRSLGEFTDEVDDMFDYIKGCPPIDPNGEVLIPYEIESKEKQRRLVRGIMIEDTTWKKIIQIANSLDVSI